jgi:hypothetical protein
LRALQEGQLLLQVRGTGAASKRNSHYHGLSIGRMGHDRTCITQQLQLSHRLLVLGMHAAYCDYYAFLFLAFFLFFSSEEGEPPHGQPDWANAAG